MSWNDDPTMPYEEVGQRGGASLATLAKIAQMTNKASSTVEGLSEKAGMLKGNMETLKGALAGGAEEPLTTSPEDSVRTIIKNTNLKNAGAQARAFMQYVVHDPAMRLYFATFVIIAVSISGFAYMHHNPSANHKRIKRSLWYNACASVIVLLLSLSISSNGEALDLLAHTLMVYVLVRGVSSTARTMLYADKDTSSKSSASLSLATHTYVIACMGAFLLYDLLYPIGGWLMAFFRAKTKRVTFLTLLFLIICAAISGGMSVLVIHPEYNKLTLSSEMNLAAESVASVSVLEMTALLVMQIAFAQYVSSAAGSSSSGTPSMPSMPSMPSIPGMPSMPSIPGFSKSRGAKRRK